MSELRHTPLYYVLHRANLFLGGDRELVLMTMMVVGGIAFISLDIAIIGISICLWFFCIYWLRKMAKVDAQMRQVYVRNVNYNRFYPARSHPLRDQ